MLGWFCNLTSKRNDFFLGRAINTGRNPRKIMQAGEDEPQPERGWDARKWEEFSTKHRRQCLLEQDSLL